MKNQDRMGKIACIRYKGGAKDDDLVDDRSTGEPLAVVLGEHRVPKGIEDALFEMEIGEQRQVEIPSELGYGAYNSKEVQWYPRTLVDNGYLLKKGSVLVWTNPEDGRQRPARVIEATEDTVRIDLNHPFAGKDLEYWVELVDLK
ncbi:MAG: peptidylprolyl isomerase [Coriobacteriia bacterium]